MKKRNSSVKELSEMNLLSEHRHIHVLLNSLLSPELFNLPAFHVTAWNITIWFHMTDSAMPTSTIHEGKVTFPKVTDEKGLGVKASAEEVLATRSSALDLNELKTLTSEEITAKLGSIRDDLVESWHAAEKMRERCEKLEGYATSWQQKADKYIAELKAFRDDKLKHLQGILRQKEHIQSLAEPLMKMQRQHYNQYSGKAAEKGAVIAATAKNPNAKAILENTTVYSTIKPGHERWEPILQTRVQEYLSAGVQLQEMESLETNLTAKWQHAMDKFMGVNARFRAIGEQYNVLRDECNRKTLLVEQYELALGNKNNFVTQAKGTLGDMQKLLAKNPGKDYLWAFEEVLNKTFGKPVGEIEESVRKGKEEIFAKHVKMYVKGKGKAALEAVEGEVVVGVGEKWLEEAEKGIDGKRKGKGKAKESALQPR
ncbi:MAG: hypothetical protein Q9166_007159 [cf. Caloplaca sp. 2 TL-2023]